MPNTIPAPQKLHLEGSVADKDFLIQQNTSSLVLYHPSEIFAISFKIGTGRWPNGFWRLFLLYDFVNIIIMWENFKISILKNEDS